MKRKSDIEKELEELSPELAKLKKENPFEVPENYFSSLEDSVMDQIRAEHKPATEPELSWIQAWSRWIDIAFLRLSQPQYMVPAFASVAAIFFVVQFVFLNPDVVPDLPTDDTQLTAISDLSEDEVEDYLLANINDLEYLMYEETEAEEAGEFDWNLDEFTEDELEEYLEYNIDESLIMEELL